MKVLKSMLLVATLMLLSTSSGFAQSCIDIDVPGRVAPQDVSIYIDGTHHLATAQLPSVPLRNPVKVEILDEDGNLVYTKIIYAGATRVQIDITGMNASTVEVSQAGAIIICEDIAT